MTITEIETRIGVPYISRGNISKQFGMSLSSVDLRIKEIKEEIQRGRYSDFAIIKEGGFCFVSYLVFIDYMKHRDRLKEKNMRKGVPEFDPYGISKDLGWYDKKQEKQVVRWKENPLWHN